MEQRISISFVQRQGDALAEASQERFMLLSKYAGNSFNLFFS